MRYMFFASFLVDFFAPNGCEKFSAKDSMFFASFLVDFFAPNGCEKFSAKDSKILSIHADFITTYYFEFCGFR